MTFRRALRRIQVAIVLTPAILLAISFVPSPAGADTAAQLKSTQANLDALIDQISAVSKQSADLQSQLNALSDQVTTSLGEIEKTEAEILDAQVTIAKLDRGIEERQWIIDQRAIEVYRAGSASTIALFLGAHSLTDLHDRIEIVNAAAQSDVDLITEMRLTEDQLHIKQAELEDLQAQLRQKLDGLQAQRSALDATFTGQQALLNQLTEDRVAAEALVKKLKDERARQIAAARLAAAQQHAGPVGGGTVSGHPFVTCPVQGLHAYGDSFCAPRYAGGYHPHAGVDIMAPLDAPIVAPFDGVATDDSNGLGGNAVSVHGAQGYVYNAHLSRFGQLGSVAAGTVIGYVGDSGDAQGGPTHDHFEWHPDVIPPNPWRSPYGSSVIGSAIDPFPYLDQVC
jgi:peptidoglycan hydrolase CwlO-like protein